MAFKQKICSHIKEVSEVKTPQAYHCEACIETGGTWLHLRTCQTCGITLCCDSSPNKHARKHFETHKHPVIASAEPKENWLWCYSDKLFIKY